MEKEIFLAAGVLFFGIIFLVLRYLSSKQSRIYTRKLEQIMNAEEHKVKGQFER